MSIYSKKFLPLKTPLPRSKTQSLTKVTFFLGHPVDSQIFFDALCICAVSPWLNIENWPEIFYSVVKNHI